MSGAPSEPAVALAAAKEAARRAAFARRKAAFDALTPEGRATQAARLYEVLRPHLGRPIAAYMAMRTEIDPRGAMEMAARHGPVCVPVILGAGQPLRFRRWEPGGPLERGPFGAMVPASGDWIVPEVVVAPLVAFSRAGGRLGYGGGFYDRTIEALRAARPTLAIGFAFGAQEDAHLPLEATDQPLDLIVTERDIVVL